MGEVGFFPFIFFQVLDLVTEMLDALERFAGPPFLPYVRPHFSHMSEM